MLLQWKTKANSSSIGEAALHATVTMWDTTQTVHVINPQVKDGRETLDDN